MTILADSPRAASFDANRDANLALVADLRARLALVRKGGGDEAVARHTGRGKLLARDRIDRLLDPGVAVPRALAAGGLGHVRRRGARARGSSQASARRGQRGRRSSPTTPPSRAAPTYPMTVKKHLRLQEVAAENRLPCVYLVDSGGAFLPLQADVFPDREHFGRIFFNQANLSAAGHRADRRRDGLVHRGRRVCPGDERRDGDRQGHGHDLHRRSAAGEGRDRRGGHRRRPRWRRRAHADVRRRRPLRRGRRARAGDRAPDPRPTCRRPEARRHGTSCPSREPLLDPAELYGIVPSDLRRRSTSARSSRASWTAASSTSSRPATARRW